jgi:cyclopropane fatty-acyl-phospholipid synthase-like methyltransferase
MNTLQLEQSIIDYYENCDRDYKLVWHLNSHMAMHYGYWETGTKRLRDALTGMNRKMAEVAKVKSSDYVLDAGCGVGGSSIFLAENFGCSAKGLTLSSKQVNEASANALRKNVTDRVSFEVQNFCNTNFADATFDVIWATESVCHVPEKADFLKEAYRLLKPGGRIVVADFFRTRNISDYWMRQWAHSWAVAEFEKDDLFPAKAESCGFNHIEMRNISARVTPSVKRLYYYYFPGVICDRVLRILGFRNSIHRENMRSTLYQYKSFMQGSWQYYLFYAEKGM